MRPSIMLASALAATALAKPLERRQVVVTDVEIVYTTVIDTVTAGQQAAATPAAASLPHKHHSHHHSHHSKPPASSPPPAPSPPASSSEAPAPAPAPTTTTTTQPLPPVVPVTTSETSSGAASQPTGTGGVADTYQQAVVNHHNYHRANHSSPDLTWDDNLATIAMNIAKTCVYAHNMSGDHGKTQYGQNIAAGNGASDISAIISDQFYNGEINAFTGYGQAQPDMSNFESWGHMSQVVWKSTTSVGCASWNCGSDLVNFNAPNGIFTVCNYGPPGNYENEYGANIGNSQGQATITGDYDVNKGDIGSSYTSATGQSLT